MYNTDKLKELRKAFGITGSTMAKQLNITPSFYSQLENNKRRLFYEMALKIAKIFKMKPDDIFYIEQ